MKRRDVLRAATVLAGWPAALPGRAADPLARLDPAVRRAVDAQLRRQAQNGEPPQVDAALPVDLDGDGQAEWAVMWTALGPTSATHGIVVFQKSGVSWRVLTQADLWGQVQRLRVEGRELVVDTLMPGPRDPRCCPTRKAQQRLRWQSGRLRSSGP